MSVFLYGSTYLGDCTDRRESLHIAVELCPRTSFSLSVAISLGSPNEGQKRASGGPFLAVRHRVLPFNRNLENGKSQRYMLIDLTSGR